MYKKIFFILATTAFCLTGCLESDSYTSVRQSNRIDTVDGMIEYLQGRRLPPLKSIKEWKNKYGPGLKLTTEHYEVYTTLLEPLMLSQVPGFMESAYRGYQEQLPEIIETKSKFTIYLFAQRQQWEDFTEFFAGPQAPLYHKIKSGAYYLNGACVVYNIGREKTFAVLGHEGWHQFNSRHFKFRLPSWLDEGVAMLFEVSRYKQGLFYFEPGKNLYRLGALKQMLAKNRIIPLRRLITLNPGEVLATDKVEPVTAFYAQSYALVRFLREDEYGKRLRNYHQLLLDGFNGRWPLNSTIRRIAADRNIPLTVRWNRIVGPQLFKLYVTDEFEKIQEEYVAFCKKIVYRVRFK